MSRIFLNDIPPFNPSELPYKPKKVATPTNAEMAKMLNMTLGELAQLPEVVALPETDEFKKMITNPEEALGIGPQSPPITKDTKWGDVLRKTFEASLAKLPPGELEKMIGTISTLLDPSK
ncbi:MAG: hypothetical protein K2X66_08415 [Cyanobacteria bacterium]|nr:hypothetical protein [Cyanobacteriota bacterium]